LSFAAHRKENGMGFDRIELTLLKLPYVHYFETSFGREFERTFILVRVCSDGLEGWGEVVADQDPLYSYETTTTAWHILSDFLIPMTLEDSIEDPREFHRRASKYKGHPMAKAGLELALWDLAAKKKELPLWKVYGGTQAAIPAGVSIGIQDTPGELLDRIGVFLGEGYRRVKIKIKPGWDTDICAAIRDRFPNMLLQADANGGYRPEDEDRLSALDEFNLQMLEQPFPPYDLWDHSRLQKKMRTPVCLDESILSLTTTRQAIEMGSCRIVNIKVGRVGGIVEALAIHDLCREKDVPVWCGGMLESGIGRAHNIHLASLPNFRLPNDISASRRYYSRDLIEPEVEITREGFIPMPQSPGIGVVPREDRIRKAAVTHQVFS
jgi:O-succinylbenzoate synthase